MKSASMRRFLAVSVCLVIAGCSSSEPPQPSVIPRPHKFLRVHGHADPSLAIRVSTQYQSTEKHCQRARNTPQSQWLESEVTRTGNDYEATVTFDHFFPGSCGWRPFVIAFQVTNQAGLTTGQFAKDAQGTKLVPGPESKVWISAPDGIDAPGPDGKRMGAIAIRPLDLRCSVHVIRGTKALTCITDSPRELPLITVESKEVRVDFRDLTG
jgi:hypothetical protein